MGATIVELPLADADDCVACAERLRDGLVNHRGVVAVEPLPGRDAVSVSYDPDLCSLDCLGQAASGLRLDLASAYAHRICRVDGMDCADCAQTIERAVSRLDGVTHVAVSFPAATMRVEYRPSLVPAERIAGQVARLGYRVEGLGESLPATAGSPCPPGTRAHDDARRRAAGRRPGCRLPHGPHRRALLCGGDPRRRPAAREVGVAALAATRRPDINLLMAIAAAGAAAIGAWLEASLVVVLFSVGELLESRAVDRTRRELAGLVSLAPETARVRRRAPVEGLPLVDEVEVPVAEVASATPSWSVRASGFRGRASSATATPRSNQAPITGESTPVDKAPGDTVFAGTLNGQGLLLSRRRRAPATRRSTGSAGSSQRRRRASLRRSDGSTRSPRWYTPGRRGRGGPRRVGPAAARHGVRHVVLRRARPAHPRLPVRAGDLDAGCDRLGARPLVRRRRPRQGRAHLEQAAAIRGVAFDKTGTLTEGRPAVVAVEAVTGDAEALLDTGSVASSKARSTRWREQSSAQRSHAASRLRRVEGFEALTGLGARGRVDGATATIGAPRLFDGALGAHLTDAIRRLEDDGQTVVAVARGHEVIGLIGLADAVRPEAPAAVADLRRLGVSPIVLVTGDTDATAAAVAGRVGIDDVHAGLLPQEKAAVVESLGSGLAMVGDGVNDAPALAAASLGVAMGSAGSDTAIEVADAAIMGDDPRTVAGLIGLARWTKAVVRQNIAFSLGTKLAAGRDPRGGSAAAVGCSRRGRGRQPDRRRQRPPSRARTPARKAAWHADSRRDPSSGRERGGPCAYRRFCRIDFSSSVTETAPSKRSRTMPSRSTTNTQGSVGSFHWRTQRLTPLPGRLSS